MTEKNLSSKSFDSSSSTVVLLADMAINDRIVGIYKSAQNRWIDDLSNASTTLKINNFTKAITGILYFLSHILSAFFGGFLAIVIDKFLNKQSSLLEPMFWSFIFFIGVILIDYLKSKLQIDYRAAKKDIDRTLKDMKSQQKPEI